MRTTRGIFLTTFMDSSWDQTGNNGNTMVLWGIVGDDLGGHDYKVTPSLVPSYQHPRPDNKDIYIPCS